MLLGVVFEDAFGMRRWHLVAQRINDSSAKCLRMDSNPWTLDCTQWPRPAFHSPAINVFRRSLHGLQQPKGECLSGKSPEI